MLTNRRTFLTALSVALAMVCLVGAAAYCHDKKSTDLPTQGHQQAPITEPTMQPGQPTGNTDSNLTQNQALQAVDKSTLEITPLQRVCRVLAWSFVLTLAVGLFCLLVLIIFNRILFPEGVQTGWLYVDESLNTLFSFLNAEGGGADGLRENPMQRLVELAGRGELLKSATSEPK